MFGIKNTIEEKIVEPIKKINNTKESLAKWMYRLENIEEEFRDSKWSHKKEILTYKILKLSTEEQTWINVEVRSMFRNGIE